MRRNPLIWWCRVAAGFASVAPATFGHMIGVAEHDAAVQRFARAFAPVDVSLVDNDGAGGGAGLPRAALLFEKFGPSVRVRADERYLYIESNGLPAHGMMVGITAWQQQVPLPQSYRGANAWRIPLHPEPSAHPVSIRGRFLRGAIALAANGIPIFNPQNNRGEISAEIGELDQWGGHCGRADDYHYHAAPLHLQSVLGRELPIALALDGYPIFGLTEPDGSVPNNLDAFDGHETTELGYHYHAALKYPYVNGGFHGVVTERNEQVDPQPRASSPRPALPPLRGAQIVRFTMAPDQKRFALEYTVNGRTAAVNYATTGNGKWMFQFIAADGTTRDETFAGEPRRGAPPDRQPAADPEPPPDRPPAGDRESAPARDSQPERVPPPRRDSPPPPPREQTPVPPRPEVAMPRTGAMRLWSPAVGNDGVLPKEFTGDGESASPPLEWSGAPAGTKSFAVIMHHIDPEGQMKWYWTLYNIPADVHALPKNSRDVGTAGNNSIDRRAGYAPPHSKGPGAKTYVLTVYALSAPPPISAPPATVNRAALLAAMKDLVLDTAELKVTYTRSGNDQPGRRREQ